MKVFQKHLKVLFTYNIKFKVISVVLAFFVWNAVIRINDPAVTRQFNQIPVEVINTDSISRLQKMYEILDGTDTISVTVTARRSVFNDIGRDNFKATADMSRMNDGLIPIEVKAIKYSDRIDNINLKTNNVKVQIENREKMQFSIKPETVGTPAEGYVVGNVSLDKNVIKVLGPKSVIDKIESARVRFDVTGLSGTVYTSEVPELLDRYGKVIEDERLSTSVSTVMVTAEILETKTVKINYGYTGVPADGYGTTGVSSSNPSSVTIAAKSSELEEITAINIPASAIDITGAKQDVDVKLPLESYVGKGVRVITENDDSRVNVHIEVKALSPMKVNIPVSNIYVTGLPDNMSSTVINTSDIITVDVMGMPDSFNRVNPALITGTADVSKLVADNKFVPGSYAVPVLFELPKNVRVSGNITVNVLIQYVDQPAGLQVSANHAGDNVAIDVQDVQHDNTASTVSGDTEAGSVETAESALNDETADDTEKSNNSDKSDIPLEDVSENASEERLSEEKTSEQKTSEEKSSNKNDDRSASSVKSGHDDTVSGETGAEDISLNKKH